MNTMYGVTGFDNLWNEIESRARNNYGDWKGNKDDAKSLVETAIDDVIKDISESFLSNHRQIESIANGMCE